MNANVNFRISALHFQSASAEELNAVSGGAASCGCPPPSGGNRTLWDERTQTGVIFGDGFIYYQGTGGGRYVG